MTGLDGILTCLDVWTIEIKMGDIGIEVCTPYIGGTWDRCEIVCTRMYCDGAPSSSLD